METSEGPSGRAEVLWDEWGVPHIYAGNHEDACFAYGWAQARAHATLVLELYGIARGRAAEYWGDEFYESDLLGWTLGTSEAGQSWWDGQSESARRRVEAFCSGFNLWCRENPESATGRCEVLPVVPSDVFAHYARNLFHYSQLISDQHTQAFPSSRLPPPGSNAWAVAGERSASGKALLVGSPHLPWSGRFLLFESHSVSPGRDFYGAGSVGMPWANYGFNESVGWSHTTNPIDLFDVYRLTLEQDGYLLDGQAMPFTTRTRHIAVKEPDGSLRTEETTIRHSVHGPIVTASDESTAAVRIGGLTVDPALYGLEAWWEMSCAHDIDTLYEAINEHRLPMFTVIAADSTGRVGGFFAGHAPNRPHGAYEDWNGWLPGDSSDWLWYDTLPQSALPRITDPAAGYVQNTNDPPWTMTWPPEIAPKDYPATVAPAAGFPGFRALMSNQRLGREEPLSLDDLISLNFDTSIRMADHVLEELLRTIADAADPDLRAAHKVLSSWDRRTDADSVGSALFFGWVMELASDVIEETIYERPWSPDEPFTTPSGLRDPERCAAALQQVVAAMRLFEKPLTASLGDEWRMKVRDHSAPADGGPGLLGVLKALRVAPDAGGDLSVVHGLCFVAAVEFGPGTTAEGLLVYDNWTEPGVPFPGKQLQLACDGSLRPIHLTRTAVEENLYDREVLDPS